MSNIQTKISNALKTNKFNPIKTGERKWYDYFLSIEELVWSRNFIDGFLIHVYSDEFKTEHLATYTITHDVHKNEDILQAVFDIEN